MRNAAGGARAPGRRAMRAGGVPVSMLYSDEWRALAARIRGLSSAAQLHCEFATATGGTSSYGILREKLSDHCGQVAAALSAFQAQFGLVLPREAGRRLEVFLGEEADMVKTRESGNLQDHQLWAAVVL